MTPRERFAALATALLLLLGARAVLRSRSVAWTAPVASTAPPVRTSLAWCYPDELHDGLWATARRQPAEAVRVMCVARDAVTGERINARVGLRQVEATFGQVTGGAQVAYWDVPAGFEVIIEAASTTHYSASGYRRVPEIPGSALAMTTYLLPRPAPLVGTVQQPGERLSIRRPAQASDRWGFVDRLRASGLATAGFEGAWRQLFTASIAVQPDGTWGHSAMPGLPIVVRRARGEVVQSTELTPVRDINRVVFGAPASGPEGGGLAVTRPPYPDRWPVAHVSLRVAGHDGGLPAVVVRAVHGPGGMGGGVQVAAGRGSLVFELPPKTDLLIEVRAEGYETRTVPIRLQPWDRWFVPEFLLERAR